MTMTRSTVQIQHINLGYPIWQKFDLTGFCLPYFRVHSVLNSNSLRPWFSSLQGPSRFTAFFFNHVGVTKLLDFKRPECSKIEGRLQISKC